MKVTSADAPALEVHPPEAQQLGHRAGEGADDVAAVQLHDVGTRPGSGVGQPNSGDHRLARRGGPHLYQLTPERGVGQPVPERQGRGGREVGDVAVAPQCGVEVGVGLRADRPGQAHRQPPRGVDPPGQHAGHRRSALLAGEERLHDGRTAVERPTDGIRPAGEQHEHHRCARVEHGLHQSPLNAGQLEVVAVTPLPDGPPPEEPGLVADDHDGDLRALRGGNGIRDAVDVAVVDAAPERHAQPGARPLTGERLAHGRHGDADRGARVLRDDVVDERVAAEERLDAVGIGADDGHRVGALEREDAVVGQEHHRLLRQPGGHLAVLRPVELDVLRRRLLEGGVEQPELLLLSQGAQHRAVDQRLVDPAVAHGGGERREVGVAGGQLDVDTGGERQCGRLTQVGRHVVQQVQEGHPEVVGDDRAVEAPAARAAPR